MTLYNRPLKPPVWTAFIFPIANYGSGWQNLGYFKDPFGIVHFRGMGTTVSGSGVQIGLMPAGIKPVTDHIFPAVSYYSGAPDNLVFRLDVQASGWVTLYGASDTQSHNDFISISGVTYDPAT